MPVKLTEQTTNTLVIKLRGYKVKASVYLCCVCWLPRQLLLIKFTGEAIKNTLVIK